MPLWPSTWEIESRCPCALRPRGVLAMVSLVMWSKRWAHREPWDEARHRFVIHRTAVAGPGSPAAADKPL